MENYKEQAELEDMRQCEDIFSKRLLKFKNQGQNHSAVHYLGFDRQGVCVFTIFGTLLEEQMLHIQHLLEVGSFFKEKLVRFRILFFTDPDRHDKNHKAGEIMYSSIFQFDMN